MTTALPRAELSVSVAVTVTVWLALTVVGAVYKPDELRVPRLEGLIDHVTPRLLPLTDALNCRLWEGDRVTADGVTVTVGLGTAETLITPPAPETAMMLPDGVTPVTLVIGSGSDDAVIPARSVTVTTATTPLDITFEFSPVARQVTDPLAEAQFSVLPAAVAAAPAVVLTDVISLVGYVSVHCKPAGELPLPRASDRFNETVPPGTADPDDRLRLCPYAEAHNNTNPKKANR